MSVITRSSTVDGILRRSARAFPERVALRFEDREWTYAALDAAVSRAAAYLLGLGLQKGDRVELIVDTARLHFFDPDDGSGVYDAPGA